jgi:hypothetical protein
MFAARALGRTLRGRSVTDDLAIDLPLWIVIGVVAAMVVWSKNERAFLAANGSESPSRVAT